MILMVSGRTDIVAFYTKWFMNRIQEGFFDVRNPFNYHHVSRIYYDDVEAIMFCTKNPLPIIKYLPQINKPIVFHVTLTPYKKDIEPNVIDKKEIVNGIKEISKIIGIDNLYLRYDPILINDIYTIDYHIKAFEKMCCLLKGYVNKIIVSFVDDYKNVRNNYNILKYKELTEDDYKIIGLSFSKIANENNMTVQTCAENRNLFEYGFIVDDCLSKQLATKLTGRTNHKKWNARKGTNCNCVEVADIGDYNSCSHMCKYCYANYDEKKVKDNMLRHNPNSSLLLGELEENDNIIIRKK